MTHTIRLHKSAAIVGLLALLAGVLLFFVGAQQFVSAASSLSGGATFGPGHVILVSDLSDNPENTANDWSAVSFDDADGIMLSQLAELSAEFNVLDNNCGGGSPRFQVGLTNGVNSGNISLYFGTEPNYDQCPQNVWDSTGNLLNGVRKLDTSQLPGGTFYDTYAHALSAYGAYTITGISIAVDAGWSAVASGGDNEQTVLIDNVKISKFQSTTYEFSTPPPPPPTPVTVTIIKYIDGVHATAGNADSLSFPMNASWDAANIGAGSGSFALSTTGFNNPNAYEATTVSMDSGAEYSLSEDVTGPNVGASCADGKPFALAGYSTGASEAAAAAATPSGTAPALTNITSDTYIIVWNADCTPVVPPPPANACATPTVAPPGYTLQTGTAGNDNVTIAPFTMFVGVTGTDTVNGPAAGNYIVCTGAGNDTITLGDGDFTISANTGNNSITVGNGTGYISTGSANDRIKTGNGVQTIEAGNGNNTIETGDGDKTVTTGPGLDRITTGGGNDTINAGNGINTVNAGAGDDSVTTGASNDTVDGGPGTDTCSVGGGSNSVSNCEL